jgi:hypothetical protein
MRSDGQRATTISESGEEFFMDNIVVHPVVIVNDGQRWGAFFTHPVGTNVTGDVEGLARLWRAGDAVVVLDADGWLVKKRRWLPDCTSASCVSLAKMMCCVSCIRAADDRVSASLSTRASFPS